MHFYEGMSEKIAAVPRSKTEKYKLTRGIEENVLSLLKQKDLKMPDENTFKSAFADANCPKETRSYTLAHLKTKKILRKHAFCELMP